MATASDRKDDHLRIAAGPGVLHTTGSGPGAVRLRHHALPGRDLDDMDLTTSLLRRTFPPQPYARAVLPTLRRGPARDRGPDAAARPRPGGPAPGGSRASRGSSA